MCGGFEPWSGEATGAYFRSVHAVRATGCRASGAHYAFGPGGTRQLRGAHPQAAAHAAGAVQIERSVPPAAFPPPLQRRPLPDPVTRRRECPLYRGFDAGASGSDVPASCRARIRPSRRMCGADPLPPPLPAGATVRRPPSPFHPPVRRYGIPDLCRRCPYGIVKMFRVWWHWPWSRSGAGAHFRPVSQAFPVGPAAFRSGCGYVPRFVSSPTGNAELKRCDPQWSHRFSLCPALPRCAARARQPPA